MKITAIETIRLEEFANLLWLRVHTDEGLVGLGETFFAAPTVEAYLHEVVAPQLLGRDPLAIDRIAKDLDGYVGFRSTGVGDARHLGHRHRALGPLRQGHRPADAQLLGGFSRRRSAPTTPAPATPTCGGKPARRPATGASAAGRTYDDLDAF